MKIPGVALVTGANRGLGRALTQALIARGVKVYAGARDPRLVDVAGAIPVRLDVTNPDDVAEAARTLGDVSLVINNAGVFQTASVTDPRLEAVARESFEVNFFGPMRLAQAFAPILAANGGGALVNVLSVLSWTVLPGTGVYSATKAAGLMWTDGLRTELSSQGTQVVAVHAAFIDTQMSAGLQGPKTSPEVVAQRVLAGLEEGQQEILVDEISRQVKSQLAQPKPRYGV